MSVSKSAVSMAVKGISKYCFNQLKDTFIRELFAFFMLKYGGKYSKNMTI
jgi:hypothetical protein